MEMNVPQQIIFTMMHELALVAGERNSPELESMTTTEQEMCLIGLGLMLLSLYPPCEDLHGPALELIKRMSLDPGL